MAFGTEKAATSTPSATTKTTLPRVYFWLWHPLKTWLDIFIGPLLLLVLTRFHLSKYLKQKVKVNGELNDQQIKDARVQHAESMRRGMNKMLEGGLSSNKSGGFYMWSSLMKCDIVEVVITVPRNDAILQEWKIIDSSEEVSMIDTSLFPTNPTITLYVAFPISILPHTIPVPTEKNKFGCLMLDCHDILTKLPKHIPLSVFFHGGGLTIGTPRMTEQIDLLLGKTTTTGKADDSLVMKPFIYISVDYSLAPEFTFPIQPIEACSVVSYLLDLEYKLQLCGNSAGAYLVMVASLEAYRVQHPHRANIQSVIACCPMLSPATDTISFYQNQSSSHACPVHFLRWCYRSYFNLPEPKELSTSDQGHSSDDLFTVLGRNSTRSDYYRTPWYQSPNFRRLIEPAIDVPLTLGTDTTVPQFVITTNKADPLHDGGIQIIQALRAVNESIVVHHDDFGSHWIGTRLDSVAYQKLVKATQDAIFHV